VIRRLRISWRPGRKVTGDLAVPPAVSGPAVLLAHGAGAGRRHSFMTGLRDRLAGAGHPVLAFDYPYVEAGRRAPDRLPVLLECHRAAAERLVAYGWGMVLAGKSMGGRVASHLAAEDVAASALVCYGYPLVSPSTGAPRSTDHLDEAGIPMLFLSGSRDRLAPLDLLRRMVARIPGASLQVIEGAGHSFTVAKRTGLALDDVLDRLAGATEAWLGARPDG
jgi:predicted alpha/beta-hydrolase family hydrolase